MWPAEPTKTGPTPPMPPHRASSLMVQVRSPPARCSTSEMDGVGLLLLDDVGWIETAEVDAAPTRHENQRAIVGSVALIVLEFGLGFGVGLVDDHRHKIVDEQLSADRGRPRRPFALTSPT